MARCLVVPVRVLSTTLFCSSALLGGGPLNALARHQVNTRLVEQHYDDLLRVAGSLLQRHTTASQLVRALRSHTRHLASLARALQHLGRAATTIHLLDYCNDQPFRRRILTQLNRDESRHGSPATSATATAANCASATARAKRNNWARSA